MQKLRKQSRNCVCSDSMMKMMEISPKTRQNVNLVLSAILARIPRRRSRKPRGPDLSSHYDTPGW